MPIRGIPRSECSKERKTSVGILRIFVLQVDVELLFAPYTLLMNKGVVLQPLLLLM